MLVLLLRRRRENAEMLNTNSGGWAANAEFPDEPATPAPAPPPPPVPEVPPPPAPPADMPPPQAFTRQSSCDA